MSSDDESYQAKKRRIQRACDVCRRKKIRCDGSQTPGIKCSSCAAYDLECSYVESAKKRGPPKAYVEGLENRVDKMEQLLRRLMSPEDFEREVSPFSSPTETAKDITPRLQSPIATDQVVERMQRVDPIVSETVKDQQTHQEDRDELMLSDKAMKMSIAKDMLPFLRFYGKSSNAVLVRKALDMKTDYTGKETNFGVKLHNNRRHEFWQALPQWEDYLIRKPEPRTYVFPEQDLLEHLVDLYFRHMNIFIPLLHRPTFLRQLEHGLHLREEEFGAVVLLVCANASRYSNDPRVRLDGEDSWLSSGWKWFDQVQLVRKDLLSPSSLCDLQFYYLSCQFLQGSSVPHASWTMVGMGLRLAQDVGAHRRSVGRKNTVEDELMKRAFWAMLYTDYSMSAAYGRPCGLQEEDYDLDFPTECDDEYWEHPDPEQAWRQPPGKPSTVSFFVSLLKLVKLLALALRTIYSINKSRVLLGFVGPQWEQRIVTELDSALNKWVDTVPEHLRWDPSRDNDVFFKQSAELYTEYYLLQVLIHRHFIPSPKKPSPLSFPSLAICTNAARSCSHIADIQRKRTGTLSPFSMGAVFSCGIILLLNIWGGKRSGLSADPAKEMADVHKCMEALRAIENRWHPAGRLWDVLYELASVGELPLPQTSPAATNKRGRDEDSPISAAKVSDGRSQSVDHEHRSIAGSRRAMKTSGNSPQAVQVSSLPMYSQELGRLPVYGQFNGTSNMAHDEWAQLDGDAGYLFSPMGGISSTSNGVGGSTTTTTVDGVTPAPGVVPNNDMNDMQFPHGFPTLADAEFFDHLASMSWTTNRTGQPSSHYYGEGSGNPSSGSHQAGQPPMGLDAMSMWSEAPPGFDGSANLGNMWGTTV